MATPRHPSIDTAIRSIALLHPRSLVTVLQEVAKVFEANAKLLHDVNHDPLNASIHDFTAKKLNQTADEILKHWRDL